MTSSPDAFDKFQSSLEPYIKPREHVNYIRRVLALHLGSCSHDGPIKQPVSLVDSSLDVTSSSELKGIQREFIEALKTNVAARRQYDNAQASISSPPTSQQRPSSNISFIEERIALLKLQNKQDRLLTVQKYFDILVQKPAASQDFLDPAVMFEKAGTLPKVPKEVVNSLVAQHSSAKPDLKGQVIQLEKTVLRTKLLLRREEQLLQETRSRAQNIPDVISNGTRLEALNTTRNELINWIETELGKASGDEEVGEDGAEGHEKQDVDHPALSDQLENIKDKYARYVSARRLLLTAIAERSPRAPPPVLKPAGNESQADESIATPSGYLLTPYIENLLALSRRQKAIITEKSHATTTLSKQTKDACQTLGHIAEESQLLPLYPVQAPSRRKSVLGDVFATPSPQPSGFAALIQPWVFAADSAKIATLETVAEKVEVGQVGLEHSMKVLQEIDNLLGQDQVDEDEVEEEKPADEDFWLTSASKHPKSARKHTKKDAIKKGKDAWSGLHGNLGLIGHDDLV
ncbi:hypothetical protein G7046_g5625 [Stylonectria norvegica]|nr:hypothetical protein G7046_g5625 [Stylonectria norvegica]